MSPLICTFASIVAVSTVCITIVEHGTRKHVKDARKGRAEKAKPNRAE